MRDLNKIEQFADALNRAVIILESMDDETLEAINDRTDLSGDDRIEELSDWVRYAWFARLNDPKIKQLCRFLTDYWDNYPNEASASYPDISKIRQYLSSVSGLTVSADEADAAVELWDHTEGDI